MVITKQFLVLVLRDHENIVLNSQPSCLKDGDTWFVRNHKGGILNPRWVITNKSGLHSYSSHKHGQDMLVSESTVITNVYRDRKISRVGGAIIFTRLNIGNNHHMSFTILLIFTSFTMAYIMVERVVVPPILSWKVALVLVRPGIWQPVGRFFHFTVDVTCGHRIDTSTMTGREIYRLSIRHL